MFGFFKRRKGQNYRCVYTAAQILGECDFQVECFHAEAVGNTLFAIITDGIKDARHGRNMANYALEIFKDEYRSGLHKKILMERFFQQAIGKISKTIADHTVAQNRRPAIIALIIENGVLYIAELHDNIHGGGVYICKNNQIQLIRRTKKISSVVVSEIKLMGDEVILLASNGTISSLSEMAILHGLTDKHHPNKAKKLRDLIIQKRIREQPNATIIVAELVKWAWWALQKGLGN